MDRRTMLIGSVVTAAGLAIPAQAETKRATVAARNVVLVHGLFADGSCWSDVISRLQASGLNVTAVQNPLTTLDAAADAVHRINIKSPHTHVLSRPTVIST